jgi:hypothetical protein
LEGFYGWLADTGFLLGPRAVLLLLLGLLVLLVGLFHQSEAYQRLVGVRIRGHLALAYGTFGLPLILVLMEVQRRRGGGGGILRFLGGLLFAVVLVFLGVLALIAFLIYRYLRRRR